jgi:hypothetical protein
MADRILDPDGINTDNPRLDAPVDGEPIPVTQDNNDDVIPSPDDTPPPSPTDTPPPDEAPKKDDEPTPDVPKPVDEPNMPLPPLV